jgi:hypothetical protein
VNTHPASQEVYFSRFSEFLIRAARNVRTGGFTFRTRSTRAQEMALSVLWCTVGSAIAAAITLPALILSAFSASDVPVPERATTERAKQAPDEHTKLFS